MAYTIVKLRFALILSEVSYWLLCVAERIVEQEIAKHPEKSDAFQRLLGRGRGKAIFGS